MIVFLCTHFTYNAYNKTLFVFCRFATLVLEWEKSETEKEISETTKALDLELDISRLYVGLEPNTNYRLVSMVKS